MPSIQVKYLLHPVWLLLIDPSVVLNFNWQLAGQSIIVNKIVSYLLLFVLLVKYLVCSLDNLGFVLIVHGVHIILGFQEASFSRRSGVLQLQGV